MGKATSFTVRFCVGDPGGLQAGIWRVWTVPKKSDVYLGIRTILGEWKISLHASGGCYASITRQSVTKFRNAYIRNGKSRHLDIWVREISNKNSISVPLRIRFPYSELRPAIENVPTEKELLWVPAPPFDHSVDVICLFTKQQYEQGDWPWHSEGAGLLASTELPNGETLWLISQIYLTPPSVIALIQQQRARATFPKNTRLLIGGELGPGNIPIVTDAAAQ